MRPIHRVGVCLALAALPCRLTAQQQIVFENGDRLTGRLLRIDAGVWVFRAATGEAKSPATRVTEFTSADRIGIRLADGTITAASVTSQYGYLQLALDDGSVRLVTPADFAAVGSPDNLTALRPIHIAILHPIRMFWGGRGTVGFSDKTGNSRSRGVALTLDLQRKAPKDRITVNAGAHREYRQNEAGAMVPAVSKYYASGRLDVYFSTRLFTFAEILEERDRFQDLDLRSNFGAGLGLQAVATKQTDLRFSLSAGVRIENFALNGSATSGVVNSAFGLKQRLGPAALDWQLTWAPNVKDLSDYRLRSNAAVTMSVYGGLGFRVGVLSEYNSNPRPDVKSHDLLFTTSLAYSVGALR